MSLAQLNLTVPSGSSNFDFLVNSCNVLSLVNNGNIGIGTTNPISKLDINGILNISNNLQLNLPQIINSYGGAGDRIILYKGVNGVSHPYSFGMNSNNLWYSVPNFANHNFYVGGNSIATINSNSLNTNILNIGTSYNSSYILNVIGTSKINNIYINNTPLIGNFPTNATTTNVTTTTSIFTNSYAATVYKETLTASGYTFILYYSSVLNGTTTTTALSGAFNGSNIATPYLGYQGAKNYYAQGTYNLSPPSYISLYSGGTIYYGDWIIIQYPYPFNINYFTFIPCYSIYIPGLASPPKTYYLLASNDGLNFTLLLTKYLIHHIFILHLFLIQLYLRIMVLILLNLIK